MKLGLKFLADDVLEKIDDKSYAEDEEVDI